MNKFSLIKTVEGVYQPLQTYCNSSIYKTNIIEKDFLHGISYHLLGD